MGNDRGAYSATEDYTNAAVMIAIYPNSSTPHVDIYWKNTNGGKRGKYVGDQYANNVPKYSIRINIK